MPVISYKCIMKSKVVFKLLENIIIFIFVQDFLTLHSWIICHSSEYLHCFTCRFFHFCVLKKQCIFWRSCQPSSIGSLGPVKGAQSHCTAILHNIVYTESAVHNALHICFKFDFSMYTVIVRYIVYRIRFVMLICRTVPGPRP